MLHDLMHVSKKMGDATTSSTLVLPGSLRLSLMLATSYETPRGSVVFHASHSVPYAPHSQPHRPTTARELLPYSRKLRGHMGPYGAQFRPKSHYQEGYFKRSGTSSCWMILKMNLAMVPYSE